jgi:predicted AAA+ superfamily ATPase
LSGIVDRRLDATLRARLTGFPVVVLAGAWAVGKSVMLRQLADEAGVIIIDLDDLDTRALASADPATFVSGPAPVCIDEFQHVPQILDAIKAELNRRSGPGGLSLPGLPAWGTTLASKAGALPKLHLVDSGVAGQMTRITSEKLLRRLPQTLTEYGHLMETFVVNEVLKQASWFTQPVVAGHWRERGGEEVDLVLERADGAVAGIEVKASSQVRPSDASGLITLARRLGDRWLAGVVFYTGQHTASLDPRLNIFALPVDALWT